MALSTLADLRTELAARGFDYLSSTRLTDFLNYAYTVDVSEADAWPFLETSTTGTSPVTVSDLRTIESVIDTTNQVKLRPMDRRHVTDLDVDLTRTGTPEFYYVTTGNVVATYPVGTGTLSIRYWKTPTALSADADEPLLPTRFRALIVDAAEVRAYTDDDEADQANIAQQRFLSRLEHMRLSLMGQQFDRPESMVLAGEIYSWET